MFSIGRRLLSTHCTHSADFGESSVVPEERGIFGSFQKERAEGGAGEVLPVVGHVVRAEWEGKEKGCWRGEREGV